MNNYPSAPLWSALAIQVQRKCGAYSLCMDYIVVLDQ